MVKDAMILMAGMGTRFLPATKGVAKELFPIGNKPALLFQLKECLDSGIKEVTIVISKQKKDVIKFLKPDAKLDDLIKGTNKEELLKEWREIVNGLKINFVYQSKKMNGSAGAVYSARKFVKDRPFVVLFGDDVCIAKEGGLPATRELINVYNKTGKYVLGTLKVSDDVVERYGIAVLGGKCKGYDLVTGFKEKPKRGEHPSNLASLARYLVLPSIWENINKGEKHANGEVFLPEIIAMECEKGNVVSCEFDAKYHDLGNKLEFVKCTIEMALKDNEINGALQEYIKGLNL